MREPQPYWVYIVECKDKSLYTGICRDIEARIIVHNTATTGAKYTRSRRPVCLVYASLQQDKGDALREEARIKSLTREQKLTLIAQSTHSNNAHATL